MKKKIKKKEKRNYGLKKHDEKILTLILNEQIVEKKKYKKKFKKKRILQNEKKY